LENLIERAYILETSPILQPESFPSELFETQGLTPNVAMDANWTLSEVRKEGLKHIERNYLKERLIQHKGKSRILQKQPALQQDSFIS